MVLFRGQFLTICVLLAILFSRGMAQEKSATAVDEYGSLIIHVTWGDLNNTPADDVFVVAHGYNSAHHAPPSYDLKQVHPGQYESSSLPPGVYDVFVSEGNSVPRCKRVLIQPKKKTYWTLKLEDDEVYTSK